MRRCLAAPTLRLVRRHAPNTVLHRAGVEDVAPAVGAAEGGVLLERVAVVVGVSTHVGEGEGAFVIARERPVARREVDPDALGQPALVLVDAGDAAALQEQSDRSRVATLHADLEEAHPPIGDRRASLCASGAVPLPAVMPHGVSVPLHPRRRHGGRSHVPAVVVPPRGV